MKNRSVLSLQKSGEKASTKSYYLHFGLICSNSSTLSFDLGKGEEEGGGVGGTYPYCYELQYEADVSKRLQWRASRTLSKRLSGGLM